jgi:transcriptional regulator of heat shock response
MELTTRQEEILKKIVSEYIRQAEPIGSERLKSKYKTDLSSATIRNEMQKLTDMGYLEQPHTSAGRIPADKGYRYLVDILIEKEIDGLINNELFQEIEKIKEIEDSFFFLQRINRILSSFSSGLIFSYLPQDDFCLSEGWASVFKDPEFSNARYTRSFVSMIDALGKNIDCFELDDFSIKVYIGKEVPMPKCQDFSIVISKCLLKDQKAVLAIIGPKRMPYSKNIPLVSSVINLFKNNE